MCRFISTSGPSLAVRLGLGIPLRAPPVPPSSAQGCSQLPNLESQVFHTCFDKLFSANALGLLYPGLLWHSRIVIKCSRLHLDNVIAWTSYKSTLAFLVSDERRSHGALIYRIYLHNFNFPFISIFFLDISLWSQKLASLLSFTGRVLAMHLPHLCSTSDLQICS